MGGGAINTAAMQIDLCFTGQLSLDRFWQGDAKTFDGAANISYSLTNRGVVLANLALYAHPNHMEDTHRMPTAHK